MNRFACIHSYISVEGHTEWHVYQPGCLLDRKAHVPAKFSGGEAEMNSLKALTGIEIKDEE